MRMRKVRLERDWAGLPPELVTIIGEKVTTHKGYVHLRLVCKAWRRALPPNPRHLPPQGPWLLLPQIFVNYYEERDVDYSELSFYDPFRFKTHRFQRPYISDKDICGSSFGWLVLEHDHRVSLFNPLTQCVIDLPHFDAPPTILISDPIDQEEHDTDMLCVLKAVLSCNPSEDGCFVVASFQSSSPSNWELGFCRIGDTHWTGLKTWDVRRELLDFTCHKNLVYTADTKREVSVYDLEDLSVWTFPSKFNYNKKFHKINLVEGDLESGDPLLIRTRLYSDFELNTIFMYKWFEDRQAWCQVRNIGKGTLFLNWRHCINLQLEEGHENQLYYDARDYHDFSPDYFRVRIRRVKLECRADSLLHPNPMEEFPSQSEFPIWFTPSLIYLS
ncbi:F-box family protein [Rhynchospora pubera]|uniref:F-box family protein n=1 Tax=Rhynchospora pubera TaxID=906938 RepID=A0AAV8CHY3_9POAL|nr:F-box family protein [Rhynchospora pubera]